MTPEDRARQFDGDWHSSPSMPAGAPVPADDDSADLVSSDLAAAATGTVYALLFVAVIIGAAVVFG